MKVQVLNKTTSHTTVDEDEISRFSKDAADWWDESGPFAPLHRLNPARLNYIKSSICRHYGRDEKDLKALKSLNILDVGCGGGIVSEPLARLGGTVTGIDADDSAIRVAREHAEKSGVDITYLQTATENLIGNNGQIFDVVLALEIIEHVSDIDAFVTDCVNLCRPGGLIIFSTLNRTLKSMALGKIAAEYILRWVPAGTHDWKKFVKPSTLAASLRNAGARPQETMGLIFRPLHNDFALSRIDLDVNYFMTAIKE